MIKHGSQLLTRNAHLSLNEALIVWDVGRPTSKKTNNIILNTRHTLHMEIWTQLLKVMIHIPICLLGTRNLMEFVILLNIAKNSMCQYSHMPFLHLHLYSIYNTVDLFVKTNGMKPTLKPEDNFVF